MATNKQIYETLQSISNNLPDTDIYTSSMRSIKIMSYSQSVMKNDIRDMTRACGDRRFGCGNNK
jgi:hypothetical protein